jgi:hypothetical protein
VDPRTGLGLTDHSLVTIIAPDCTTADSLATAVSVLGPAAGLRLVEATPRVAAHIVRQPGERIEGFESQRFRKFVERAGARERGPSNLSGLGSSRELTFGGAWLPWRPVTFAGRH